MTRLPRLPHDGKASPNIHVSTLHHRAVADERETADEGRGRTARTDAGAGRPGMPV
ncbi:hypothetical protein ABZX39_35575 [Streptomyces collinus]|uniref:hypothetical protein n=1 Tax=Streptomyces collinus TaxID=42684 RepID=UPI0033BB9AAB